MQVYTEKGEIPKCRVLFSFYATTVIGVLETGPVTEVVLSTLLPHISKGMKSEVTEYKAASYMVLAQLLHKAKLKQDLIKTLQQILAKVCQKIFRWVVDFIEYPVHEVLYLEIV